MLQIVVQKKKQRNIKRERERERVCVCVLFVFFFFLSISNKVSERNPNCLRSCVSRIVYLKNCKQRKMEIEKEKEKEEEREIERERDGGNINQWINKFGLQRPQMKTVNQDKCNCCWTKTKL